MDIVDNIEMSPPLVSDKTDNTDDNIIWQIIFIMM